MGKHFGRVAYDAKGREVQIQQPQVQAQQAKPQDPQDPWANTGQNKNSVMDGIRAAEHNLGTACDNMTATKGTCYAMEMGAQTMKLGGELLGALGKLATSELGGQEQTANAAMNPHLTRSFAPQPPPPPFG